MITRTEILIFDIDGVITDPSTKKIGSINIIRHLESRLEKNIPVCFNTGRSSVWVRENIISSFSPETPLELLYCVCEMGEVVLEYDKDNHAKETVSSQNLIPLALKSTIREIVMSSYYETMFVDETKKVILTVEMKDGLSKSVYEKNQSRLSGEIRIILKNYHPNIHIRPSSSSIAIDIKPINSNKASGAAKILTWLRSKKVDKNISIVALGDSASDLQMAEYFHSMNIPTKFIYVGNDNIDISTNYKVIKTIAKYTEGTLEFLNS